MATRKSVPVRRAASKAPTRTTTVKPPARTKAASTAPVVKPVTEAAKTKQKLVRDSFTIPKAEYAALGELKQRATRLTHPAKKSVLLRAGISALRAMSDTAFLAVLVSVPSTKPARPKLGSTTAVKAAANKA